uniref:hypothetical protein n=1 Tax=Klebsiella pneumoniae TaxID=573 RepID=UPI001C8F9273
VTLDDHGIWHEALTSGSLGAMTVRVALREAMHGLSAEAWHHVPRAIQDRIAKLCEETSGTWYESLKVSATGQLDWRQLLRRYVQETTEQRPIF